MEKWRFKVKAQIQGYGEIGEIDDELPFLERTAASGVALHIPSSVLSL
jgi:hypothetical protein